jgi:hypothetical protein
MRNLLLMILFCGVFAFNNTFCASAGLPRPEPIEEHEQTQEERKIAAQLETRRDALYAQICVFRRDLTDFVDEQRELSRIRANGAFKYDKDGLSQLKGKRDELLNELVEIDGQNAVRGGLAMLLKPWGVAEFSLKQLNTPESTKARRNLIVCKREWDEDEKRR